MFIVFWTVFRPLIFLIISFYKVEAARVWAGELADKLDLEPVKSICTAFPVLMISNTNFCPIFLWIGGLTLLLGLISYCQYFCIKQIWKNCGHDRTKNVFELDLAERASMRELEQQDLEKLTIFSTDSFKTTSLHAPSPEDVESRPNPITLKTWIELTDRIKNKIKICSNLRKCQLCRIPYNETDFCFFIVMGCCNAVLCEKCIGNNTNSCPRCGLSLLDHSNSNPKKRIPSIKLIYPADKELSFML